MNYDLAIVGGGPAGTSAAIRACELGLRVLLCERHGMSGEQAPDKVCGEFVSGEALACLEAWTPELLERAPRIGEARLQPVRGRETTFALPQAARGISRPQLDAALWRAAGAAGATVRARTAVGGVRGVGGSFELRTAEGERYLAPAVVWATGRRTRPGSPWVGVKARFEGLQPRGQVELYGLRHGYGGVAPVEEGRTNVCCLIRAGAAGRLRDTGDMLDWLRGRAGSAALVERLRGGEQASATVVTSGVAMGRGEAARGAELSAGDASGFVDPFTGDGIARALLSGQLAAEAIARGTGAGYAGALATAAQPGLRAGAGLRAAVLAPGWAQSLACRALAWSGWGPRLAAATRWRS